MAKYLSFLLLLLTLASCKKAEMQDAVSVTESAKLIQANIVSVNGPTTAIPGKPLAFTVSWPHTGEHHAFNSFKADTLDPFTYNVKLYVDASSCTDCMPDTSSHTSVFTFKPAKSGVYYLKFYGKDTTQAITDTLQVR